MEIAKQERNLKRWIFRRAVVTQRSEQLYSIKYTDWPGISVNDWRSISFLLDCPYGSSDYVCSFSSISVPEIAAFAIFAAWQYCGRR